MFKREHTNGAKYQKLLGKYYDEEVARLEAKPLWPQFDNLMRLRLYVEAYKRAKNKAQEELEIVD